MLWDRLAGHFSVGVSDQPDARALLGGSSSDIERGTGRRLVPRAASLTIEEAIRAYTYNTAYANFEEKTKGSIEVHKIADLVVLTRSLLQATPREILDTKVVYTIVGGKIVHGQ